MQENIILMKEINLEDAKTTKLIGAKLLCGMQVQGEDTHLITLSTDAEDRVQFCSVNLPFAYAPKAFNTVAEAISDYYSQETNADQEGETKQFQSQLYLFDNFTEWAQWMEAAVL